MSIISMFLVHRNFSLSNELFNPYAYVFGFVGSLCLIARRWKWSIYRVLDNFSVSIIPAMAFWLLTQILVAGFKPLYLLASVALLSVNYLLRKYRLEFIKSGYTFCLISFVFCAAGILSSRIIPSLIFLGLLFTLTLVVLIYRSRGLYARVKKNDRTTNNA